MKVFVIYDSQFGNTERVAQVIARAFDELDQVRAAHISQLDPDRVRDADLLILGCPTQAWNATPGSESPASTRGCTCRAG
jgi:flavodoxin